MHEYMESVHVNAYRALNKYTGLLAKTLVEMNANKAFVKQCKWGPAVYSL